MHGLGSFVNHDLWESLVETLPAPLGNSLRKRFEWYACRGAFFHNDAHYSEVLFGAWCAAGPPREIVFARPGLAVPAAPGDWAVFDPFEPHAVLDQGAATYDRDRYSGAEASVFVGFEVELDEAVRRIFGIAPPEPGAPMLASSVAIHAETGALG